MTTSPATQPPAALPVRRRYPDAPLVGVAAAVFNQAGQVLLIQRGRPPGVGNWGIPGGLLDLGEKLHEGARREVKEECSVEIEIGNVAGVFEPITLDASSAVEYHFVVIDFWASYIGGELKAGDDALDARWVDVDQLSAYTMPDDTRRIVATAHSLWQNATRSQD
jgi:8-oxo-dGTP diphosphatase